MNHRSLSFGLKFGEYPRLDSEASVFFATSKNSKWVIGSINFKRFEIAPDQKTSYIFSPRRTPDKETGFFT